MPPFGYAAPERLDDALAALEDPGSMPLAGGTDLLPSLKHRLFAPERLISLRKLRELRENGEEGGSLRLGAGTTLDEVAALADARYPALAAACRTVGTPAIQGMGTLGGNLRLDTRCVFYNQPIGWRRSIGGCLKRDGSVCHVAPRGPGCLAAHSSDTVPALILYDAEGTLRSSGGSRVVRVVDLWTGDGAAWHRLLPGELIVGIRLPPPRFPVVHRKVRLRGTLDYAQVLVAVRREESGFRAIISAVGPAPVEVTGETPDALAAAAHAACHPLGTHLSSPIWRRTVLGVEVRRAAESLI